MKGSRIHVGLSNHVGYLHVDRECAVVVKSPLRWTRHRRDWVHDVMNTIIVGLQLGLGLGVKSQYSRFKIQDSR